MPLLESLDGILRVLSVMVVVLVGLALVFAALAITARLRTEARTRRWRRLERAWQKPILDVIDGDTPPDSLEALVVPGDALYFVGYAMRYDRLLGGEEHKRLRSAVKPYLHRLIPYVRRGNAERRARAVQTLARVGLPEYADAVAHALDDPSPLVAMIAARGLFRPGCAEHFPTVLAHLDRFEDWNRGYLTKMLAGGGPEAAPLLRELLSDGARPTTIRVVAATALRELNDLDAVETAHGILAEQPGPGLAIACLRLVGHAGHAGHATLVRRYARSDHDAVRAAALETLGSLGDATDLALLEDHLQDSSTWAALSSGRALLELSGSHRLEAIAQGEGRESVVARQVIAEADES